MAKHRFPRGCRIKFPTGLILWLDDQNQLQSEPPAYAEDYRARHPHSPSAPRVPQGIESCIEKLYSGELVLK